jgi:hypothetical protein
MGRRIIEALLIAGIVLFIGYMCGAPIIYPDIDNFFAYTMASILGVAAYFRPD